MQGSAEHCDPALAVHADEDKVRQIPLSLLTNALKFTEPGGRAGVTCDAKREIVAIRVRDTSIGDADIGDVARGNPASE